MRQLLVLCALAALACNEQQGPPASSPPGTGMSQPSGAARMDQAEPQAEANASPQRSSKQPAEIAAVAVSIYDYVGVPVEGTAQVDQVISDRGFWVRSGDNRMLAVVREDVPQHEMIDIDRGQRIKFTGLVLSKSAVEDLSGELEPETRRAILGQPAFIAMSWRDVSIME
jgi:hypothetical protein